jgi:large subunit ribosomal protein L21
LYTVIKTGGKQFKVDKGDIIKVEMISGEVGELVKFNDVLALGEGEEIKVGTPFIDGAEVVGKILRQAKEKKVIVFKKKKRKGYSRKAGHRQQFTEVLIEEIMSKKLAKKSPKAKGEDVKEDTLKAKTVSKEEKKPEKKVVKKATKAKGEDAKPSKKTGSTKASKAEKKEVKKDTE